MDHPWKSVHFLRTEKRSSSCPFLSPIIAILPEHCIVCVHCRISKDAWDRKEKKRKIRKSSSRGEKGRRVQSNKMKERERNENVTQFRFLFRSYASAKKKKKKQRWLEFWLLFYSVQHRENSNLASSLGNIYEELRVTWWCEVKKVNSHIPFLKVKVSS